MILGKYQQEIKNLPPIPRSRYENIFRLYTTENNQYFYNILQSIYIDGDVDPKKIFYMTVRETLPWSIVSFNAYGTTELWWLIALINNITNPIKSPDVGRVLKVLRPEYVNDIIGEIQRSIQN
jgi:hypothetical protein